MRRASILVPIALAVFSSATASAAEPPDTAPKNGSFGADAVFSLPVGNLSDVAGPGFGALLRVDYRVADSVSVGGRAGFVYQLSKSIGNETVGISEAPIFASARYHFLGREPNGPYAAVELGPVIVFGRATATALGASASSSANDTKFGGSIGGGYALGAVDLRAGLLMLDLGHLGDTLCIVAGVGYTFAAF
jgi:hypothetical protein